MMLRCLSFVLALLAAAGAARAEDMVVDGGILGQVRVLPPAGETRAVALLISDRQGWGGVADAAAGRLTARGIAVIAVDLPVALARMAVERDACVSPQWAAQDVSHEVQRRLALPTYELPWIAGIGQGATVALALARQARAATFAGVVGVDSRALPATDKPLCPPDDVVDLTGSAVSSHRHGFADAVQARAGMTGVDPVKISLPPDQALAVRLLYLVGRTTAGDAVDALPLTELPVAAAHGFLAIVYSGDGGWRDLDKDIAQHLQSQGVPTVGLDMLRYFWRKRDAAESAADLARIIARYKRQWGVRKVVLIGYSFGADILPALYNLLPEAERSSVMQLSLLGLSDRAAYEVTIGEFLGGDSETTPTRPEIDRIPPALIQCIAGGDDHEAICRNLKAAGIEVIETAGSHHFDGDYPRLAQIILDAAVRRAGDE